MFHELFVRRPLFHALEKQLRRAITDDETRARLTGDLVFYTENSPRRSPHEHAQFRAELESMLGKADSDQLVSMARTLRAAYRFTLNALKVAWAIVFLLGTWGMARFFIGWGWNPLASLLAAAFVAGAILEVAKWLLAWRLR